MTKPSSSQWRTILPGLLVGVIGSLTLMFGSTILMSGIPPYLLTHVALIGLIVAAIRLPRHRNFVLGVTGGGLAGLLISFAVTFAFVAGIFKTSTQDDLKPAELEQWVGLDFPASATKMRSHAEGFQDWQVFVRFEMPKSDVKEFLRINHLGPESNPNTQLANTDLERDWWTPDGTTKPRLFVPTVKLVGTPQPSTKTGFYPTIQVSDLEGGLVMVYISAFNT